MDLHSRLDELRIRRGRPAPASAPPAPAATTLAELIGGTESRCTRGACWQIDTPFASVEPKHKARGASLRRLARAAVADISSPLDLARLLLLDLETGGFSGAPVFLIGVALLDAPGPRVVQWLVRDYPEEEVALRRFAALASERDLWVTFNGRAFDEPFLRERATLHRISCPAPRLHVDLLHLARRRYRGQLPNCKLTTLERHLLGRERVGDVAGADIPPLFHHFVRTGNARPLRPVIEHNRLDLVTSAELLLALSRVGSG